MVVFDGNFAVGCWPGTDYPLYTYISMYATTNRFYNERSSRTNYVGSNIIRFISLTSKNNPPPTEDTTTLT